MENNDNKVKVTRNKAKKRSKKGSGINNVFSRLKNYYGIINGANGDSNGSNGDEDSSSVRSESDLFDVEQEKSPKKNSSKVPSANEESSSDEAPIQGSESSKSSAASTNQEDAVQSSGLDKEAELVLQTSEPSRGQPDDLEGQTLQEIQPTGQDDKQDRASVEKSGPVEEPGNPPVTKTVIEKKEEPEDKKIAEVPSVPKKPEAIAVDGIKDRDIKDEMQQSYLDYAMSVIVGRALPDVRDGLKPVHRRILFAMNELGMFYNKSFKKCARIVGEVLGKYHPHGDSAVYDALVRMAQNFSMRHPLIRGQGNFGSIDGDHAAAMRYTEAKLEKISNELLQDLDKETVDFVPNFDNSLKEPSVLPSKSPNLLINGSSGIAVGMATVIPPHNLKEVCTAVIKTINNPDILTEELITIVPGPDFPTAGIICGSYGIRQTYNTGRGRIRVRGRVDIEEGSKRKALIITELPYMVNKAHLVEQIANLVRDKVIGGVSDIRDESDRQGMRVVIELKRDANTDVLLNQLYKHSRLQVTFGVIMVALQKNQPRTFNLKQLIQQFILHRQEVIRRRTEYDLRKAEDRSHILEGLIIALDDIDAVVAKIKKSPDAESARNVLMQDYSLSEKQAQAILDMRLQKLASLEQEKIRKEQVELLKTIEDLKAILASEEKILEIIKNEQRELIDTYGESRKTEIIEMEEEETDIDYEDLIEEEDVIITFTHAGYIKRQSMDQYKQQRRGGTGIKAAGTKEEDFVEDIFIGNTHNYLLFFTNMGNVYWKKIYYIPEASRQSKGQAVVNLIKLSENEKVTAYIPVKDFKGFLVMATRKGIVKKTSMENFSRPRKGGIRAISIDDGDELISVKATNGNEDVIIATKKGIAIRFSEEKLRAMGRTARGVRGIRLKEKDKVIGLEKAKNTLFTVTENGYGKRTDVKEYRTIGRGGSGVKNIKCTTRNGSVVAVKSVEDNQDLMLISKNGIAIRTPVRDISTLGRATQGVRIMRLRENDKVVAAAKIIQDNEANGDSSDNT